MAAGHSEDGLLGQDTINNATLEGGFSIWQLPAGLCSACLSSAMASALALAPSPGFSSAPKCSVQLCYFSASSLSWSPAPALLLTPFLPCFIHFTAPKDLSLLFASAPSRFFSPGHVALFFLTSTGDLTSFHHGRPQVYSLGGPVPKSHHRKAKPKPERPECTNSEQQVLHYFIPQLAVQRLLNRHAVH